MRGVLAVCALLLTSLAAAQTITFSPQGLSRVPGLVEYRVYVQAPDNQPLQVQAIKVVLEAMHQNIRIYDYVNLQAYIAKANKRSRWRWAGIGMEVLAWGLTTAQTTDAVKISEKYKVAFPLAGAGLTLMRSYFDREYAPTTVPADLMQPLFAVPAGQSVSFAVFAAP